MGKAKKGRNRKNQPYESRSIHQNNSQYEHIKKTYLHDISSLDEHRRKNALSILSNVFALNVSNIDVLTKLSQPELLAKLSMRVVDSSDAVRQQALIAVQNLTSCEDESIIKLVDNAGILNLVLSLLMAETTQYDQLECALQILAYMTSTCEECFQKMIRRPNCLAKVSSLISKISCPPSLRSEAAKLFLLATDSNIAICESICCQPSLIELILSIVNESYHSAALSMDYSLKLSSMLFTVRCCGILVNVYGSNTRPSPESLTMFRIPDIINILVAYLEPNVQVSR
jgi:hypothetical protein